MAAREKDAPSHACFIEGNGNTVGGGGDSDRGRGGDGDGRPSTEGRTS